MTDLRLRAQQLADDIDFAIDITEMRKARLERFVEIIESALRQTAEEVRQETQVERFNSTLVPLDKLKEMQEQLKSMAWQPIETAPKDGTSVLVYDDGAMTVSGFADGSFWDAGQRMKPSPTHWMPLPAAPPSKEPER